MCGQIYVRIKEHCTRETSLVYSLVISERGAIGCFNIVELLLLVIWYCG